MRAVYGLNAIAIRRDKVTHISPEPNDMLKLGDTVTVVGTNDSIHRLETKFGAQTRPSRLS